MEPIRFGGQGFSQSTINASSTIERASHNNRAFQLVRTEELSEFIEKLKDNRTQENPTTGRMLWKLLDWVTGCFQLFVNQSPQSFLNHSSRETVLMHLVDDIWTLYDCVGYLTSLQLHVISRDARSWLDNQQAFIEQVESLRKFQFHSHNPSSTLHKYIAGGLARHISEIDRLSPASICTILQYMDNSSTEPDGIYEVLLPHIDRSAPFSGKELYQAYDVISNCSDVSQREDRIRIALMNNIARAVAVDCQVIVAGLLLLNDLTRSKFDTNIRDEINVGLQLLARHISKLTDLEEYFLSSLFDTSESWKHSPSAGNVLNALIQPLSSHAQLDPRQMNSILSLLDDVGSFEERTTLMNLLGMHIWGGAKDFDLETIFLAVSCLRYMTNNSEQVLHALTRRVNEINIPPFNSISIAANIRRLSPLLQNRSIAAKQFVATLLKKLNYSIDIEKLHSVSEQEKLVKGLLKDRRTEGQVDLKDLPTDLAEFYLDSVLNELRDQQPSLPELKLIYGSLGNTLYNKSLSLLLPLKIIFKPNNFQNVNDLGPIELFIQKSISREVQSGEWNATWNVVQHETDWGMHVDYCFVTIEKGKAVELKRSGMSDAYHGDESKNQTFAI